MNTWVNENYKIPDTTLEYLNPTSQFHEPKKSSPLNLHLSLISCTLQMKEFWL